jgi:hypothetical protein
LQKGLPVLRAASLASDDEGLGWVWVWGWVWYIGEVDLIGGIPLLYITHVEKAIQFFFLNSGKS